MSIIDIIFIVIIVILTIRCALRGFIEDALSIASVVLGIFAALFLYKNGAAFIRTKILSEVQIIPEILAFTGLFCIVFGVIKIIQTWLKDITRMTNLSGIDRFLGIIFGLLEGITVVSAAVFILSIQPIFDAQPLLDQSIIAKNLLPLIQVPPSLPQFLPTAPASAP